MSWKLIVIHAEQYSKNDICSDVERIAGITNIEMEHGILSYKVAEVWRHISPAVKWFLDEERP